MSLSAHRLVMLFHRLDYYFFFFLNHTSEDQSVSFLSQLQADLKEADVCQNLYSVSMR